MKRFFLLLVFIAAAPIQVLAALDKFPSTPEEILQHHLENSDYVYVRIDIFTPKTYDPFGGQSYWFRSYLKDDGTSETINALARRSRQDLEALFQRIMREAVRVNVDPTSSALAGKLLQVTYGLWKDVHKIYIGSETIVLMGLNEAVLAAGSDGRIRIPEEVFAVDLLKETMERSGIPFFVPSVLYVELTVENDAGQVIERRTSDDKDFYSPGVYPEEDELSIATVHLTNQRRGKLTLWYRGGAEQTFDRMTGKLLETVLPDLRPVTISRYGEGILLSVQNVGDKGLVIDAASDLPRWNKLSTAAIRNVTKADNGDTAIILSLEGARRFFQARVIPSSIRIR